MYAETGLLFPYYQGVRFTHHQLLLQQLEEEELSRRLGSNGLLEDEGDSHHHHHHHGCHGNLPRIISPTSKLVRTSSISEYYLGGEGDLFNAPEPIIEEEPHLELDPMAAAISMMSAGEDITSTEVIKVADSSSISEYFLGGEVDLFQSSEPILDDPQLELDPLAAAISMISSNENIATADATAFAEITSIDSEQLLNEFFSDTSAIKDSDPDLFDVKIQPVLMEADQVIHKENMDVDESIAKSVSMECLTHEELANAGGALKSNFLDFSEMDFGACFGMRRAYSEGDIKTLSNGNLNLVNASVPHHPIERLLSLDSYRIEERQEKLSRYRRKKTMRNFGRKIKYACRKALADSQPRVRGRFARTEECEVPRLSK